MFPLVLFVFLPIICYSSPESSLLKSVSATAKIWPNQTVFYFFHHSSNYTKEEQDKIKLAAKAIQEKTCIDFIEGPTENHAIAIIQAGGCSSVVGSTNPENLPGKASQPLLLGSGCLEKIGTPIHEFMHALGMGHTHTRSDRDQFIIVDFNNIQNRTLNSFVIKPTLNITPYDYTSFMQYAANLEGAVNGRNPVMLAKDPLYRKSLGAQQGSFYDYHGINLLYKCYESCKNTTSANCTNGGVPHPRNCSICLCPSGFGGDLCDQRPGTCGETFTALAGNITPVSLTFGKENDTFRFVGDSCTYWIHAPPNHRVNLFYRGADISGENKTAAYTVKRPTCSVYGFEFKIRKDPRLGGPIFCHDNDWGVDLTSDLNPAPLILFRHRGQQTYHFQYQALPKKNKTTEAT